MDDRPIPTGAASAVVVVGLGPGDLHGLASTSMDRLTDPSWQVIVRTLQHPAAQQLASLREVVSCDDLYESSGGFDETYAAIVERILSAAESGPVIYAVPGSPRVGEFAVARLEVEAASRGVEVQVVPAQSFIDAVIAVVGVDPLDRGLQILNGHALPDPLVLDKPTIVAQCDLPLVLADVIDRIGRVVPAGTEVSVVVDGGGSEQRLIVAPIEELDSSLAGVRTSLFLDPKPGGLIGVVQTMRRLREECPWDRQQTHSSLVKNLIEETFELVDALAGLVPGDWGSYAEVEDELGDVLLQVLFHSAIARQDGAFDIDDVSENLRQKLVRRHPHVFADFIADSPEEVKANWDRIKESERTEPSGSILDGVPRSMPGLSRAAKLQNRAAKVGFDWPDVSPVLEKLREETGELEAVLHGPPEAADSELGDLLFTIVNLARHLGADPEVALRGAMGRFESRFRSMEAAGPLAGLSLDQLDDRWEQAKRSQT